MLIIALFFTFISVSMIMYQICQNFGQDRQVQDRLKRLKPVELHCFPVNQELEKSLGNRLFGPVMKHLSTIAAKMTPKGIRRKTEDLLNLAGKPGGLEIDDYLAIKGIVLLVFPFGSLILLYGLNPLFRLMAAGASLLLGLILPDFMLKRAISKRKAKIAAELPDILDLLTVSVEAGLGFDQAVLKIVEKTNGPLAVEFKRVLHEIRIGTTRRDALRGLANRTGVEDLQTFVAAIIQADQLGVSIGNVLRIQSNQFRQKRRQRAEERAQKAPVKMLIPMILFIFPSLFIVLLGPGILQLMDNFLKMEK